MSIDSSSELELAEENEVRGWNLHQSLFPHLLLLHMTWLGIDPGSMLWSRRLCHGLWRDVHFARIITFSIVQYWLSGMESQIRLLQRQTKEENYSTTWTRKTALKLIQANNLKSKSQCSFSRATQFSGPAVTRQGCGRFACCSLNKSGTSRRRSRYP